MSVPHFPHLKLQVDRMAQTQVKWARVSGRWTRYSIAGGRISGDSCPPSMRFVVVPGNPGNQLFYQCFAEEVVGKMSERNKMEVEVISVSHLNHVELPQELQGHAKATEELFTLDEQVQHKIDFFRQYVPRNKPLAVMGHSIGALICLRAIPTLRREGWDVKKCYLLFPALETMEATPCGKRIKHIVRFFDDHRTVTKLMVWVVGLIPSVVKRLMVKIAIGGGVPACVTEAALELFPYSVVSNIIHMARDELSKVHEFDQELLVLENLGSTTAIFYYGLNDGWAPVEFAERMRARIEMGLEQEKQLNSVVLIDEYECEHAFVLRQSNIMAEVITEQFSS